MAAGQPRKSTNACSITFGGPAGPCQLPYSRGSERGLALPNRDRKGVGAFSVPAAFNDSLLARPPPCSPPKNLNPPPHPPASRDPYRAADTLRSPPAAAQPKQRVSQLIPHSSHKDPTGV